MEFNQIDASSTHTAKGKRKVIRSEVPFPLKLRSFTDARVRKGRIAPGMAIDDLDGWTQDLWNSWLSEDPKSSNSTGTNAIYIELKLQKAYVDHLATTIKGVCLMEVAAYDSLNQLILKNVYRGSESNSNWIGDTDEYSACLRASNRHILEQLLADLEEELVKDGI